MPMCDKGQMKEQIEQYQQLTLTTKDNKMQQNAYT